MTKNRNDNEGSAPVSLFATMFLAVCIVGGISYATYLFIDATKIPDIAGIHITKNIMLAVESIKGNLYTNEEKGIKDWIVRKDEALGLTMKYPNDLVVEKTVDGELEFKKAGLNANSKNQSLVYAFLIGEKSSSENSNVGEFIKNKYPEWNGKLGAGFFGGKEGFRTGMFKSESGIFKDIICWKMGDKFVYAESRYYLEKNNEYAGLFDKVISEINVN